MPIGQGVKGDLYLRFAVEFPSAEASFAWGSEERKTLEDLLPPKPSFPREKRVRHVRACMFFRGGGGECLRMHHTLDVSINALRFFFCFFFCFSF